MQASASTKKNHYFESEKKRNMRILASSSSYGIWAWNFLPHMLQV